MSLELYYNPFSRARTSLWMLEEVGEPYELKLVDFKNKSPEFTKLNPMGKIPTLVHDGVVITESPAICTYLADRFPAKRLAPAINDANRGPYLRWLFFAAGPAEYAMTDHHFPHVQPVPQGMIGYGTYELAMNTLESALKPGSYIAGDKFTAADLYVGALLEWAIFAKHVESRPAFNAHIEMCRARPAYQRAQKIAEPYMAKLR